MSEEKKEVIKCINLFCVPYKKSMLFYPNNMVILYINYSLLFFLLIFYA